MDSKTLRILKKVEKRANQLMLSDFNKYFYKKYEIQIIENVMCNDSCHFVAVFKDYLIADDHSEYLRRIYKRKESVQRLIKLFSYYQETSVIFPNYTPLIESKYLYNNVIRKQRVIDEQQNLEEYKKYLVNKEKKKNKQNSPLKAIENIFEQDSNEEEASKVFNSRAYYEILNTSESVPRIVFGIEDDNKVKNNSKNNEKNKERDSVKELIMKLDKLSGNNEKIKDKNDIDFINKIKKKLKYTAKLLAKKKNINGNETNSLSKDKTNSIKKEDNKEQSPNYKKNRTININININNTKNNIAMTDRPFISNNSHNYNSNAPFTTRDNTKEKRVIFNQKKIQSTIPYKLFRCSNLVSNLNKKSKNNNTNNNSINMLQQKLIEIFNKKIKKNKNNRNNSYNLSLSKNSNTSRLRTKNRAFIISTIQNTILHSKSKRNHNINIKSDKHINFNKKKLQKSKRNSENNTFACHRRVKSQMNSNIDNQKITKTKKNLKAYIINNKPILTISPSLKRKDIFGLKTLSKLNEINSEYKSKKINHRNSEYNTNFSHNSKNNSLKNKTVNKKINKGSSNILPYKSNNNRNIYLKNHCL